MPRAATPWAGQSFSQCGEDRIIGFLFRELLGIPRPTYFDIGAYHPWHLSNTAALYLEGSRGINVEPDPRSYSAFPKARRRDVNLNVGVGPEAGRLTFFRMSTPTLNTFSREEAERIEAEGEYRIVGSVEVEVQTPDRILAEHWGGGCPDFLTVDVEGGDAEILRSMKDWPASPLVVCAETATFSTSPRKVPEVWEALKPQGYALFAETFINTIFVRPEAGGALLQDFLVLDDAED